MIGFSVAPGMTDSSDCILYLFIFFKVCIIYIYICHIHMVYINMVYIYIMHICIHVYMYFICIFLCELNLVPTLFQYSCSKSENWTGVSNDSREHWAGWQGTRVGMRYCLRVFSKSKANCRGNVRKNALTQVFYCGGPHSTQSPQWLRPGFHEKLTRNKGKQVAAGRADMLHWKSLMLWEEPMVLCYPVTDFSVLCKLSLDDHFHVFSVIFQMQWYCRNQGSHPSCVTLGKLHNLSVFQFSHQQNGDDSSCEDSINNHKWS